MRKQRAAKSYHAAFVVWEVRVCVLLQEHGPSPPSLVLSVAPPIFSPLNLLIQKARICRC